MDVDRIPPRASIGPSEIHLWCGDLAVFAAERAALATLLSVDEAERAGRYATQTLRDRFVLRRAVQRLILAGYVGMRPRDLVFSYGPQGKPFLAGGPEFNLSDTDDHLACAVASYAVGVDIETVRDLEDAEGIVASYFAPAEAAAFAAVPASQRMEAFFRGWTRKEAVLKALGTGLSQSLTDVAVELAPGQPARLLTISGDHTEGGAWTLRDFQPSIGVLGAVAIRRVGFQSIMLDIQQLRT